MNCAGYYLWIVHPVPFKNTHTSRGKRQSSWSVAVLSFDSIAASCERVTRIKGMMMGIAHYLRQSHFCAKQVFEQSKPNVLDRELRGCSCDLQSLWATLIMTQQQQQRAAGVKSSAAWMSIPACQELICAPVFWVSKFHLHNLVDERIKENLKGVRCRLIVLYVGGCKSRVIIYFIY